MAANKVVCVSPLRGSQDLQPFLPGRQKPCCFSLLNVIWVPSQLWCCRLGSPAWGLDPTLLRGNPQPLKYPSGTLAATHGIPDSPLLPPTHSVPVSLWLSDLFCLSVVIRLLSSYFSIDYSRRFLYNLVVIPDWSWEEVNVVSTYSSTILDTSHHSS